MQPNSGASENPPPPPPRRRGIWALGIVIVALVVLVILLPVAFPQVGYRILPSVTCRAGSLVATEQYWTPEILLNSPYRGEAWGNQTVGPNIEMGADNGSASGGFRLDTWSVYTAENVSSLTNTPCSQPYVAQLTSTSGSFASFPLLAGGSTSDAAEMTSFTHLGYQSLSFSNGYVNDNFGGTGTCSGLRYATTADSVSYPVGIPFTHAGQTFQLPGSVASHVAYFYIFPGGGNWDFFNPQAASPAYEGGLAFSYSSCP